VRELCFRAGFVDGLVSVGSSVPTVSWTTSAAALTPWPVIDAVLLRGPRATARDGVTHDSGLFDRFPSGANGDAHVEAVANSDRVCSSLAATGSDHFPVSVSIGVEV
jgi:hypothetical protein